METKKVNVLLATYNGEKYLTQQMDSLLAQTYENIDIYIRDDGSKDKTMEILRRYEGTHGTKKIIVMDTQGENLGYPDCFWRLAEQCAPADYYAFCDQDDVWYPEKIATAVRELTAYDEGVALWFSSYYYCDEHMNRKHLYSFEKEKITLQDTLLYVCAYGFSMVINQKAYQKAMEMKPYGIAHDKVMLWIASSMGRVINHKEAMADYRRHGQAVTAANASKGKAIVGWISDEIFGTTGQKRIADIRAFNQAFGKELSEEDQKLLRRFSQRSSIKKAFYNHRLRPSRGGEAALRLGMLLGRYK